MILAFVDETSDSKFKKYFGLSCAVINSNFYQQIKNEFQNILLDAGWDSKIEFKGSFLFSATQGCTDISIEKRIEIASRVLSLNVSNKNARMKFTYFKKESDDHKRDYLKYLPKLLEKSLPPAKKKGDKDVLALNCDFRSDISKDEIFEAAKDVISKKSYTLFEDIVVVKSCFNTVGILYADIVGYLFARIDTISNDSELFENISKEEFLKNGKIKKLVSSIELIDLIKKFDAYKIEF
jgi:hypothetical protein